MRVLASFICLLNVSLAYAQSPSIEEAIRLHLAGELDAALEEYAAVAAAEEETNPNVAAAAHTNSCLIHMNAGEYELALEACEEGLRLRREVDDRPRLATTLNNLGLTLQNLGRFDESRERYRESISINLELDNPANAVQTLTNLAGLEIQAGNYSHALISVERSLELTDEHLEADWSSYQRMVAYLNEGVVLERLGAFEEALESYRSALAEESGDAGTSALLKVNLGVIYRNLGDPVRAVELFEEAIATYREIEQASGLSNALLNVALARHLNLAQPVEAESAYRQALAISREAGDKPEEILDLLHLGTLLAELERLEEAEECFRQTLAAATTSGHAEGEWSALAALGELELRRGNARPALEQLRAAVEKIELARSDLGVETHRADFFRDKLRVYEWTVQAAADLERLEPGAEHGSVAFHFAQRAKAREIFDELDRRQESYTEDELGSHLGEAGLLEYFIASTDLLRWEWRDGRLWMTNLGPAEPVLERVARVYRSLDEGVAPDPAELEELGRTLLADVELPDDDLYVSAHGLLRYLPFEVLPYGDGALVDHVAIRYLPSASTLPALSTPRERPERVAAALVDPDFASDTAGSRPAALLATRFGLARLPAAQRELASLDRWFDGPLELHSGPAATEAAFRAAATSGARIVHLATHAVMDERAGRGAAILLSPEGTDDGVLYPSEIAELDVDVDLAVLAACRTAIDEEYGGSSIASLTGAFLVAGSRAVVATLWDVGDQATATFMDRFYWHLSRGAAPAEALQRTKSQFRAEPQWSAPHLWAGYVLVGTGEAVVDSRRWLPWLVAALVLAALFAAWRARSSRSDRSL